MKRFALFFNCFAAFILTLYSTCFAQIKQSRPNVVFIVIDDLGSAWIPPYAKNLKAGDLEGVINEEYKKRQNAGSVFNVEKQLEAARNCMPFLDKLSSRGVKFNKCFTTASLCAPSRAGMLTGRYSASWGAYTLSETVLTGIPIGILTLPTIFQKNGYNTGMVGKWHVAPHDASLANSNDIPHFRTSSAPGYDPLDRGFDYYYGYNSPMSTYSGSQDLWEGRNPVPAFNAQSFLTDTLNLKAKEFVKRSVNENKPFFLYYAPMTIHGPLTPCPAKYSDKFNTGIPFTNIFAGHLLALDEGIKEIYDVLEKSGQVENTLFILCSDNGTSTPMPPYNAPFKGGKGTGWLGGSHSPLIMVMPGKTKAMFSDELVSTLDILPTALDVANLTVPEGLDGVSLKKLIFEGRQDKPHQMIFSSGLHSSNWSYSYYNEASGQNGDLATCPVYVWGLDDTYFSLHITEVKSGVYAKLPGGMVPQNFLFEYVKDPLNKTSLKAENNKQKILEAKTSDWLMKQKEPVKDRKKEHAELIKQVLK